MLNYIWAGLIVFSFGFALWADVREASSDRFRNGAALPVRLAEPGLDAVTQTELEGDETRSFDASFVVEREAYESFYGVTLPGDADLELTGHVDVSRDGVQARLDEPAVVGWPDPLATILPFSETKKGELLAEVTLGGSDASVPDADAASVGLTFQPVRLRKLTDIAQAAFDMADTAFNIALGLVGILCLWLGLVKIAEDAGLVYALVKVVRPLLGLVFPEIPKDHPALGMIALNLAANMLGLGNAATPMGLKAMEELQELNPSEDTATNSMCMFLAINTASVQLVPPATLVAIMGVGTGALWLPIIIVTGLSLMIAIFTAKALSLAPVFRGSDPMRQGNHPPPAATNGGTPDA